MDQIQTVSQHSQQYEQILHIFRGHPFCDGAHTNIEFYATERAHTGVC